MKTVVFLFLVFSHYVPKEISMIENVVVKTVDLDVTTFINVTCSRFELAFGDDILEKTIHSQEIINSLLNLLFECKETCSDSKMDIRAKLHINYKDGTQDIICIDRFTVKMKGCKYAVTEQLLKYIYNQVDDSIHVTHYNSKTS